MTDRNKTREEFMTALQKLQQKYDLLESMYQKDLYEQKQSEIRLKETSDYLNSLIDYANAPIIIWNTEYKIIRFNRAFESLTGLTANEVLGNNLQILFPQDSLEESMQKITQTATGEFWQSVEIPIKHKMGKISIVLWNSANIFAEDGKTIISTIAHGQDITARKQAEMMLKDEKELLRTVLEMVANPIFLKDNEHRIIFANPAFFDLFDLDENSVLGKTLAENVPKKEMEHFLKIDRTVLNTGIPSHIEEALTVGGKLHTIITNKTRFINKSGEKFLVGSIYDITERKQKEAALIVANKELVFQNEEKEKRAAELIVAKEHAEESDRLKSAFLANMSHEIRTPMNGILGFAGLLKEPGLTGEKQQKYIKIIEKSGDRMLNIINNIVDISKIESGLMKAFIKETNINEQVENIYNFFKPEAKAKGIRLSVKKTLSEKEAVINTDPEKIYAILSNLVKNAIKYTDKGTIEVGYDSNGECLEFYIKDTGMGIPKDRQKAIFERFIQADISDKMAMQGAGLGLSIAKAYVELLGGKIWVDSEVGIGSTFYFTIPCN